MSEGEHVSGETCLRGSLDEICLRRSMSEGRHVLGGDLSEGSMSEGEHV